MPGSLMPGRDPAEAARPSRSTLGGAGTALLAAAQTFTRSVGRPCERNAQALRAEIAALKISAPREEGATARRRAPRKAPAD